MSLVVRNSRELINPENYKLKLLIYGLPGVGKTALAATAPNPGFAACETGEGNGILTIAEKGVSFVEPSSFSEFQAFCLGNVFKDKESLVIDSLSDMCSTFIKDYALTIPRKTGDSMKRSLGVPELDDYGVMGEITRRLIRAVLNQDKHVIVTATERYQMPSEDSPGSETLIGPALPGQMFLGSTAMFDLVLRLRTRQVPIVDPKNPNKRLGTIAQRYLMTESTGPTIAKCRASINNKSLLPPEIIIDKDSGAGSIPDLLKTIRGKYAEFVAAKAV